jgi:aprataxin
MALAALRDMARLPRPSASLPPSTLLLETPSTIAIFDKYPKASYHVLVMPRLPAQGLGLGERDLDSLASLLRSKAPREVLDALEEAAAEVEEMVKDEMVKSTGVAWGVNMGFHAVPSMQ